MSYRRAAGRLVVQCDGCGRVADPGRPMSRRALAGWLRRYRDRACNWIAGCTVGSRHVCPSCKYGLPTR